jgi:hypothetical protein
VIIRGTIDQYCISNEFRGEEDIEWYLEPQNRVIDVNHNCVVPSVSNRNRNDDSSDEEDVILNDLVPIRTRPQVNAYERYIKQFTDVCNFVSVTDEGMDKVFDECFHHLRSKIFEYQNQGKKRANSKAGLASFPDISRVKKSRRKKPFGSPGKR